MLSQSKAGYLVGTGVQLFCLGGNFAMFPALCSKVSSEPHPMTIAQGFVTLCGRKLAVILPAILLSCGTAKSEQNGVEH